MSKHQGDLFTKIDDPQHVGYVAGSDTSKAAAVSMAPLVGKLKRRVYDFVASKRLGATCEEVCIALDLKHQTGSARVRELVQLGFIGDTGYRRKTTSGRSARVYAITSKVPHAEG